MKGGMQGMLKQVQKMQAEMQKVQSELGNLTVSEEAGGGMIKATASGVKELISVEIDTSHKWGRKGDFGGFNSCSSK
jgi:DNA-binding YbaB/EbfC family protein